MLGKSPLQSFAAVAIAVVLMSCGIGLINTGGVYSNDTRVAHTGDVKAALAALLQAITDAETGQRGYLITGNDNYLEPYRRGTAAMAAATKAVEAVIDDDRAQLSLLEHLQPALTAKLEELAQTVNVRRTDGFQAAERIVQSDVGAQTMTRIRGIVDDMTQLEDRTRQLRRQESASRVRIAFITQSAIGLGAVALILFITNISRRRIAEGIERERLSHSLAAIVQSSNDPIIGKDLNGIITSWNPAAERLYGYTAAEIIGQSIRTILPPDRMHEEDDTLARIRRGERIEQLETIRIAKDGHPIDVSLTISPITDAHGDIIGASKIVRDLTPLRQYAADLERQVRERTADLQAANARLEAFAFSVAHDLRAPLRGMHGLSQALLEDYGERLDEVGRDYAERIVQEATSMDTLIQDLLAYGRLSHIELPVKPVDLREVVDSALHVVREEAAEREAVIDVDAHLPTVTGNRSVLVQVFTNLLSNAIKFGGTRPRIRVWAETRDNGIAHIWMEDQGIGIAPEHQERIFGVFERLHGVETYPGTGIGLAIVRKGIERLGGHVGVESAEGRGSRFWVELPKAEAA
jgi:PAS domain S-box-containing protein